MDIRDISRFSPAARQQILEKLGQDQARKAMDKPEKYHNRKCTVTIPGSVKQITFDSVKEARRFGELELMKNTGKIRDLRLQVNFTLQEGFTTAAGERVRPIVYRADFVYQEPSPTGWRTVVEDVKGVRTKEYSMKRKMMLEKFGVKIQEV